MSVSSVRSVLLVSLGVFSCAAAGARFDGPQFVEMTGRPTGSRVYVFHTGRWEEVYPKILHEVISVDGVEVGRLSYDPGAVELAGKTDRYCEYLVLDLNPGRHQFQADYDPPLNPELSALRFVGVGKEIGPARTTVDLESGQSYFVRVFSWESVSGIQHVLNRHSVGHRIELSPPPAARKEIAPCHLVNPAP